MLASVITPAALSIAISGIPLAPSVGQNISSVIVRSALGFPSAAEIEMTQILDDLEQVIQVGDELSIDLKNDGQLKRLFRGHVASVESIFLGTGQHSIVIRAYDLLERMRQRSQILRYDNASIGSITDSFASEVGLAADYSASFGEEKTEIQNGESDLEFLRRVAGREGLYPIVEDETLRLDNLSGSLDETHLHLGTTLLEVRSTQSSENSVKSAVVGGWNVDSLKAQTALEDTDAITGAVCKVIADNSVASQSNSETIGRAAIARGAGFEKTANGIAMGNGDLRPGHTISLSGVGEKLSSRYVLTTVLHRIDNQGYTTEFGTEPPALPPMRDTPIVTPGRVVSIDDPDNRGRCRIAVTGFSEVEASWLQPVVVGAGRRKGAAILPEVGEDVLAIFPNGDLSQGFVLGGLYGTNTLPPGLRKGSDRPFVVRTGGGQILELSGDGAHAKVATSSGSVLEFDHDKARLATSTDLLIEAPGKRIVIRAASIDFERRD